MAGPVGNIQIPGSPRAATAPILLPGTSSAGSGISISGPDATVYLNGLVTITNAGAGYTSAPDRHLQRTHRHLACHRHRYR